MDRHTVRGKQRVQSLFLILLVFFVAPVTAHAPSEMWLEYDTDSQTLAVTITHTVSDPDTHYVYRIQIEHGDVQVYEYESQPTDSQFTYMFPIHATPGDILVVTAECNLGGSITGELEIGAAARAKTDVPVLWPYHAVLMVVGLLLILVAVVNVVNKTPKTSWLKAHKMTGGIGCVLIICGLIVAGYMVYEDHFKVSHAYVGLVTLIFTVMTPILGFVSLKMHKKPVRTVHVWVSRAVVVLLVITVLSGMVQAGVL